MENISLIMYAIPLFFTELLGPLLIPYFAKLKFGQHIREEGPQSHLKKQGTPTMGGFIFIISTLAASLILAGPKPSVLLLLGGMLGFAFIGFADDYIKVVKKRNLGLKAKQKLLGQLLMGLIIAIFTYEKGHILLVPFTDLYWNMGWWYYPFAIFFMVAITNSTNLTDGLDGLATGVTIFVNLFMIYMAYQLSLGPVMTTMLVFTIALIGFLRFNKYPARIFMGDTGSIAIGGLLGTAALLMGLPLFIVIVGGLYVAETLSVILQVASFKTRGKRIFKMAPLHHHFEEIGWSEQRVVRVFWLVSLVLSFIGTQVYRWFYV